MLANHISEKQTGASQDNLNTTLHKLIVMALVRL
jgi:hypothetical protein